MNITRDHYLNELKLRMNNGLVKVITGIRRCGKSYLLNVLFYNYLISAGVDDDHIIKVALDDLENDYLHDAHRLNTYIKGKLIDDKPYYVFLDEIQEVDHFVPLLNGLRKIPNVDIYITGSNSKFLSSDIVTEFRGRGDQVHVYPLSFREFFSASKLDFDEALNEYLIYGGRPVVLNRSVDELKAEYLNDLYKEIYLKDIKERYKIKNDAERGELLDRIASCIGSLINSTKLENSFKSIRKSSLSRNTIEAYLKTFEDSFLIDSAQRFDIKGKKYIGSTKKFYFTDVGLRNARLNFRQIEETHLRENIIYNELKIRGYSVDVGAVKINDRQENGSYKQKQLEIDFVLNRGSQRYYIQSALSTADPEKEKQELRPLIQIPDSFKKVIVVKDKIKPRRDQYGILTISLKDFLLDEKAIDI